MSGFTELLAQVTYFPGEFEAIEEEFCGGYPTPLWRLPPAKRLPLQQYLTYPTEERQAAFTEVKTWANAPIRAALARLKDPEKFKPKAKRTPQDRNADTLAAWLEEEGEL